MKFDVNNDAHAIAALLSIAAVGFSINYYGSNMASGAVIFSLGLVVMILYGRITGGSK